MRSSPHGQRALGSLPPGFSRLSVMVTIFTTAATIAALSVGLRSVNPITLVKAVIPGQSSAPAADPPTSATASPPAGAQSPEQDTLMANVDARAGHRQVVVSWTEASIPSARIAASIVGEDGSRSKKSCIATAGKCSFQDLTDGVEYVVTVKQKLGRTTLATKTVRAIPHPGILTGRFARLWFDAADSQSLRSNSGSAARKPGTGVKQWMDRSGLGSDAGQVVTGSQPTLTTLNGHSALAFSGKSFLSLPATTLPIGSESSAVYLVVRQQDPVPDVSCFRVALAWGSGQNNSARLVHKGCGTPLAFAETFGTWVATYPTQPWPQKQTAILRANYTAAGVEVELNGKPSYAWKTSTAFPLATASAPTATIGGAEWDPNGAWLGKIAEVIVLSSIPSPGQDDDIQTYLSRKWGA